jgi:ankyrin repeat protein
MPSGDRGRRLRVMILGKRARSDRRESEVSMVQGELLDRIAAGRTDLVLDYLAGGHPTGGRDAAGVRLVERCAYYGDVSALRVLVERGESLESLGDNLGLNGAAFHGHWRLAEFLLEAGADPNGAASDTAETALHSALCTTRRAAHDLVVRVLLAHGADPNRATRPGVETGCFMRDCRTKGETPLHRAAAFGSEETIDRLLESGAVLDARDANGETPLAWASWHVRPDSILRRLCYGPFGIHPERRPMHVSLLGTPRGGGR